MPIPLPLAVAGISAVSSGVDALLTGGQNKKNRKHQEYMYDKNNAYNTPQMQMQRYKAAGLNPHLIYGQGNSGNASMPGNPDTEAPQTKFADIAQNYASNKKQQIEIDNMRKSMEVMDADITLKAATTANTLSSSAQTQQQVAHAAALWDNTQALAAANLGNAQETGVKLKAEVGAILATTSLTKTQQAQALQNIEESVARIKTLQADNKLKEAQLVEQNMKNQMWKDGINPNDSASNQILKEIYKEFKTKEKEIKEMLKFPYKVGDAINQGVRQLWNHQPVKQ